MQTSSRRASETQRQGQINHVGTTIGAHTGPGTVALHFLGRRENE
ncbi:MAG: hypothetical protein V8S87_01600 [Oscillospiraceae bacterium]